jgi:hypothetical protein
LSEAAVAGDKNIKTPLDGLKQVAIQEMVDACEARGFNL